MRYRVLGAPRLLTWGDSAYSGPMAHHKPKPCYCGDLAVVGALLLVALSGFTIAAGIVATSNPQPTWLAYWSSLPRLIQFIPASVVALLISLWIGHMVTACFYECAGASILAKGDREWEAARVLHDWQPNNKVDPKVTGILERLVFTFVTMAHPVGAAAAMGVWLGLKMAVHWNKDISRRTTKTIRSGTPTPGYSGTGSRHWGYSPASSR